IQIEAGVENCEMFMAITDSDELNIIACIIAKKLGAKDTIARVRNPVYSQNMDFVKGNLGIKFMINPEKETAYDIMNTLKYPCAFSVENFLSNKVNMVELVVEKDSPLDGLVLKNYNITKDKVLICAVERAGEVYIPDGNFMLMEGDRFYITGTSKALKQFIGNCKYIDGLIKSVLIVGGSRIAFYLIELLLEKNISVKLIEKDPEMAEFFSETYPQIVVINADGTDQQVLLEERIENYDAVVSLTGIDEENIIISMFAISQNVSKNITKINRNIMKVIVDKLGLDTIVSPKKIIADKIIRFVRSQIDSSGSRVENFNRILDNEVEVIHFSITEKSRALNIPLKDLHTIPGILIACIKKWVDYLSRW
ncbi:MAG: Trk system potassium transporter TrkA, partial [Ezakiella massiliensis]